MTKIDTTKKETKKIGTTRTRTTTTRMRMTKTKTKTNTVLLTNGIIFNSTLELNFFEF